MNAVSSGDSFVTALLHAGNVTMTPNYKRDVCNALQKLGIDKKYWWVN